MQNRWRVACLGVVLFVALAGFIAWKTAIAAGPQAAAPAQTASARNPTSRGVVLIPDTVLAINSPTPMSQRVVHYEIDAKYDASKHTVDATEVLTYHNVTGQALDHFSFHLYQNAFQPNS